MMRSTITILLALGFTAARGGEAGFAVKPQTSRSGGKTVVTFKVSAKTDVAVSVLDAKGKVVRHLAAGMLGGEKAPPPPLKKGLAQKLEWDGKDDYGTPAAAGPFRIRVALGLKPEFDGFLLHNPDVLPAAHRVAVGPGGNVYYFYKDPTNNHNMGGHKVRLRGRDGRHLRTLVPFPADLPPEELKKFGAFRDEQGNTVARLYNYETFSLQPTSTGARARDTSCHTPAVDSRGRLYWIVKGDRLVCVDARGRCPYSRYMGPPLFPGTKYSKWSSYNRHLGVSSDDRHVYVSGVGGKHCVYRVDPAAQKPAEPFVGNPGKAGGGKSLLKSPCGVDAAGGVLYVADTGNNRIAAFKESDGSFVGELKTPGPYQVLVHGKTGALYVLSEPKPKQPRLLKFESMTASEPAASMGLGRSRSKSPYSFWFMALDDSAERARLYLPYHGWKAALHVVEDAGKAFKRIKPPGPVSRKRHALWHKDLTVDQARDELYIRTWYDTWARFDANTGKFRKTLKLGGSGPGGNQVAVTRDGRIVMYSWVHKNKRPALSLRDYNGKSIPTPKGKGWSGVMTFQQKFLDVCGEEIFVVPGSAGFLGKKGGSPHCVNVFGMDLKPKRTVIWQCSDGCVVKTDIRGNIYLGENVRPLKQYYPKFFDRKFKGGKNWYTYMYGSIVKFPPEGGAVWFKEGAVGPSALGRPGKDLLSKPRQPFNFRTTYRGPRPPGQLQGAEWARFGFAPYSSTYGGGTGNCQCEGSGFDVDGFGRVFYPNAGRFRIEVIDNSNNTICQFGSYGNVDSQLVPAGSKDGKPLIAVPDIPLAWPSYVAAGDNYAYVGDLISMRTVKVKLTYSVEATCPATGGPASIARPQPTAAGGRREEEK